MCYTRRVCGVLALLFVLIPALEMLLLIEVGEQLGAGWTLAIILATGLVGAALAKQQGLEALRSLREASARGRQVGHSLAEAALVLVAAVLLLTPGFCTDALGLALLVPALRRAVAERLVRRLAARMTAAALVEVANPRRRDDDEPPPGVIDV